MPSGRKPDYNLWVGSDDGQGRAGAAWKNDDGSISVVLDPYVVLRGRGHGGNATVKLYPSDRKQQQERPERPERAPQPKGKFDDLEDDIPF